MALKKDSIWSLCTDFRQLNNCTVTDSYRLPSLEETFDKLAQAKYFTCLDLKNGYWQIEIEESDKHKTAFSTPGVDFFEYNQMPFGLCNAAATFQHLMEQVFYDVNNMICAIYFDDILIWSSTVKEQLEGLEAVFKRLADAELKLKPPKCSFFQDKTGYLGYVISSNGVETDPLKIEAVTQWRIPMNVDDIRRFLGITNYSYCFVKNYAKIAKTLTDLLGDPKKKHGKWKVQQDVPVNQLKFI